MREIQASEAKTHLPRLLDQVENGDTIVITRHGRPIARLVPETDSRQAQTGEAIDRIEKRRAIRHGDGRGAARVAARGPPILMSFVLDASITASWALQDEGHPDADAALFRLRSQPAQVPSLWWFEVRNALFMCERRRRITEAETAAFLLDLGFLPISLDRSPDEARILGLARTHKLTLYDAAYLELSQRASLPLATLDAALRRAAEQVGVALVLPS